MEFKFYNYIFVIIVFKFYNYIFVITKVLLKSATFAALVAHISNVPHFVYKYLGN